MSLLLAAAVASPPPTYAVTSLGATVSDAQVVHEGPGEDGDGMATLVLAVRSRPAVAVTGRRTISIRVLGNGDTHARFTLAERPGVPAGRAQCSSPVELRGANTRATFTPVRGAVRVELALPYIRAPFVEASDPYPLTGPCDAVRGTLVVGRTFNPVLFTRRHVVLGFAGRRVTSEGDFTYTTRWRVTLVLTRR